MGTWISRAFGRGEPKKPVEGMGPRLQNLLKVHYRGLIGMAVPIAALSWQGKKEDTAITVCCMWFWMFWFFLLQPINIPATGLIPVFLLPMAGVMKTDQTVACYMNEGILLFIFSSMIILILNNSGIDRRIAYWFLCSGDTNQFSQKRLVFKVSSAAFWLSMFSSRLIACSTLTQIITPCMSKLQDATSRGSEPDFKEMQYILNNAIQTSCSIGSLAIIHASFTTLTFRAIYYEADPKLMFPDIFNYLEYSSFAFPVSFTMFIVNCIYHILLVSKKCEKPMTTWSMNSVRNTFMNLKKDIPSSITLHEKLSVFFALLYLCLFFFRWNKYMAGWSDSKKTGNIPWIKDAAVAAAFVIILHSLPNGYRFTKVFTAKKKSQLGQTKSESAILWWRFVDKNVVYGYIFLIGSGVALARSINFSKANEYIKNQKFLDFIDNYNWTAASFLVVFGSVLCGNIMSGVAACVVIMPLIMNLAVPGAASGAAAEGGAAPEAAAAAAETLEGGEMDQSSKTWHLRTTILSLATGMGTGLGFMFPFLYTSAYFCHYVGKVPRSKQAVYGLISAIICILILWLAIAFYAPVLWDPPDLKREEKLTTAVLGGAVTEAAEGGAPPAAEPPAAAAAAEDD